MTITVLESTTLPSDPAEPKGCLFMKTQLCGKKGRCKCYKGERHGPYTSLIKYIPVKERDESNKAYKWIYLGVTAKSRDVLDKLEEELGAPVTEKMKDKITTGFQDFQEKKKKSGKIQWK